MKTIQEVPQDSRYPFDIFKVGDGCTYHMYSDAHAYTVIKVSKSGKKVLVQRDKATLSKDFKPEVIPGGFAGHCINQREQSYTYERDEEGLTRSFSLRKWRGRYVWCQTGTHCDGRMELGKDRHEFYDYNF